MGRVRRAKSDMIFFTVLLNSSLVDTVYCFSLLQTPVLKVYYTLLLRFALAHNHPSYRALHATPVVAVLSKADEEKKENIKAEVIQTLHKKIRTIIQCCF